MSTTTTTTAASAAGDDWLNFSAITKEELLSAIHGSRAQVVNVLEARSKKMIATSRHIPLSELEQRLGELDRGREVVVYCAGPTCPMSRNAARLLSGRGFHVRTYEGGLEEWSASDFPLEEKKAAAAPPPAESKKEEEEEKEKEKEKEKEPQKEPKEKETTSKKSSLEKKNPAVESEEDAEGDVEEPAQSGAV